MSVNREDKNARYFEIQHLEVTAAIALGPSTNVQA